MAGHTSTGSWDGHPFSSHFTPIGAERAPRGIVSFFLDTEGSGNYDRRNASQRMGVLKNALWTFSPSAVAIIYGIFWMMLDAEVKRREILRQLSRPEGCKGISSVCLDYHCFWAPFAVLQAIRHRQWAVVSSSIGNNVALLAIPNIQNYVFAWTTFSGGYFDWGAEYSWQMGLLDPYWTKVLLGVLAINLVCALSLFPISKSSGFEVTTEPNGLMTLVELVRNKVPASFGLDRSHETAPSNGIVSVLRNRYFQIVEENGHTWLRTKTPPASCPNTPIQRSALPFPQGRSSRLRKASAQMRQRWNHFKQNVLQRYRDLELWMDGSPYPFLLRRWPLTIWMMFLALTFAANSYIVHHMTTTQQLYDLNYALPWNPSLYIVIGVFIQVAFLSFRVLELCKS